MNKQLKDLDQLGNVCVGIFHRIALFGIGAATMWAAGWTFFELFQKHHASIQDLLLLFIYLEIGAMVGIYVKTNQMPISSCCTPLILIEQVQCMNDLFKQFFRLYSKTLLAQRIKLSAIDLRVAA